MQAHSYDLRPASADASFRRYFRVTLGGESYIVMDAPPEKEDSRPYVAIAQRLHALGLNVPRLLEFDLGQGFLLLSDLGERLYLPYLSEATVERLYGDALGALIVLQTGTYAEGGIPGFLPDYDEALLLRELELFRDWYLVRHLGLALSRSQQHVLEDAFGILIRSARAQPQVWVHRDYHSRNLLVTGQNNPGIVDFQDAVRGPVTYDLVSLLRDCYIAWPRARVEDWVKGYHDLARQSGIPVGEDDVQFLKWFDLMGVQRHLKASGIFARLHHRDGKPGYLADIPRTLGYVLEVAARHPELGPLLALLRALHVPEALTPAAAGGGRS
ncbi:MAG: aminoglycoside phosphotransferase [Candidatus Muproteobacteria bacterium RBG_16_62_13]|uniref:Aminoglycoside phosphotransferase n=1 Tax=Candidatus Muproteobacteria bacterium RBG_16_62_13 TaxID=1817756 RepID=A0A1F6T1U9_9PROT|nr:MAG: aminoglycoside phosphotransferase [Candidatus Muproteobacteria bacterium RBG_16_62_13]